MVTFYLHCPAIGCIVVKSKSKITTFSKLSILNIPKFKKLKTNFWWKKVKKAAKKTFKLDKVDEFRVSTSLQHKVELMHHFWRSRLFCQLHHSPQQFLRMAGCWWVFSFSRCSCSAPANGSRLKELWDWWVGPRASHRTLRVRPMT